MGAILEVAVPQEVFNRRIQPFGIALAQVSWHVKMFAHDGVVLAALHLEEPNLIIALSFWPHEGHARRRFRGVFEIGLCSEGDPSGRVRLAVELDAAMVDELFVAAKLINPHPGRFSARRAEKHFARFLGERFPDSLIIWARGHGWQEEPQQPERRVPVRVG